MMNTSKEQSEQVKKRKHNSGHIDQSDRQRTLRRNSRGMVVNSDICVVKNVLVYDMLCTRIPFATPTGLK